MNVVVNGETKQLPEGSSVADLLRQLGLPAAGIAVAVNGEVVTRTWHAGTVVPPDAQVEILTAVQGG